MDTNNGDSPENATSSSQPSDKLLEDRPTNSANSSSTKENLNGQQKPVPTTEEKAVVEKLAETVEPPDGGWGWVIVFSSFIIHVIVDGITYSFGVMFVALLEDFQAGKGDTAWIASIFVGMTLGSGPIASGFVNLYGCRVITMVGAVIGALGFVISPFAPNIWFLYFSIGIVGGFGFGLIYLPAIVIVSYYFEKRRALATGLACCGSGFGTFIFSPLTSFLVEEFGWKQTCFWLAAILLQCTIFGALFRPLPVIDNVDVAGESQPDVIKNGGSTPHAENGHSKHNTPASQKRKTGEIHSTSSSVHKLRSISSLNAQDQHGHQLKSHIPLHRKDVFYSGSLQNIPLYQKNRNDYITSNMSIAVSLHKSQAAVVDEPEEKACCGPGFTSALRETVDLSLLRNYAFLLFLLSNFFTNLGFNAPFLFIPDRALDFGLKPGQAAFLVSIVGIANTVGRVLFGFVSDLKYIKPHRLYLYNLGLVVAGIATVFSFAESYVAQIIYAIFFGVFIGCYVSLTAIVLVDLLGVDKLTSSFGMTLLVQGISVLIGPPACGWIYDATGSYLWPFVVTGCCIAISGLMLFLIPLVLRLQRKKTTEEAVALGVRIGLGQVQEVSEEQALKKP